MRQIKDGENIAGRLSNSLKTAYRETPALVAFIIIAGFFGLLFAAKTPALWGGDETTHFARAYEISQGQWATKRLDYPYGGKSYGDQIPKSMYDLIWHVNDDITVDNQVTSFGVKRIDNIKGYKQFTDKKLDTTAKRDYFFPNTAVYSPLAYIPSAIAIKVSSVLNLSVGQTIFLARLFGLVAYIACVSYVLYALKGLRFSWVIFAVALIPMLVFQAAIICADVTVNALSILLIGLTAKALIKKRMTRPEAAVAFSAAALLPVVKPTYLFLLFVVLLIPNRVLARVVPYGAKVYKIAAIILGLMLLLAWSYKTRGVSEAFKLIGTGNRSQYISIHLQTEFLLHHPWSFFTVLARSLLLQDGGLLVGFFGMLSFDFIQVPGASIVAGIISLILALSLSEKIEVSRAKLLSTLSIVVVGVLAIYGSFYLTFTNVAEPIVEGVQGRYFLPFVLLALAAVCMALPRRPVMSAYARLRRQNTIVALACLSLTITTIKFYYILLG